MFFHSWSEIGRTVLASVLSYMLVLLFVRVSGKRTLAKLNAFDLIVTIALGSTLSTILLNEDVAIAEGGTAMAMLIGLQFVVAWGARRSKTLGSLVKGTPRLLMSHGEWNVDGMKKERIVRAEVRAAVRQAGIADMESVVAVVLETDGSLSVVENGDSSSALEDVAGWSEPQSLKL